MSTSSGLVPYLDRSAKQLLDDFGSGHAAPGSGSAAALMGALAAKLVVTVCEVTIRNTKSDRVKARFTELKTSVDGRSQYLQSLFQKDAVEFEQVVSLLIELRKQGVSAGHQQRLRRQSNDLLEKATSNVLEIMETCVALGRDAVVAFDDGSQHVRGDSGAALSATLAAVNSGMFIVALNAKVLKRRKVSADLLRRLEGFSVQIRLLQQATISRVNGLNAEALEATGSPPAQLTLF